MALNLIPQVPVMKNKRSHIGSLMLKKAKEPQKIIYIGVSIGIVLLLLIFWVLLKTYNTSLVRKVADLETKIENAEKEKRTLQAESQLGDFQTKISIVEKLVDSHLYWTNFFNFLEETTLSKVRFTNFNANVGALKLTIEGQAVSFTKLAEQMLILKKNPLVESLTLSSLKIVEDGIGFGFDIKLSPKAWQEQGLQKNES